MKTCDCLIIGGGIIGLTLAREWLRRHPQSKVVVLEKEATSVAHGTGRNSGVIHSGIYYTEGSLRAKLCVSGSRQMLDYVDEHKLWNDRCGKLLVPPTEASLSSMDVLLTRGAANGVDIHKVTGKEALELEPRVNPQFDQALYVPITSVVNPKQLAERVRKDVVGSGGVIYYGTPAIAISARRGTVQTLTGTFEAGTVINAAGLFADQVAKRAGLKTQYSFQPFKGKYWKHKDPEFAMRRLVYPVPDLSLPFLGVHTAHNQNGDVYFGPSSTPVIGRENYKGLQGVTLRDGLALSASLVWKFLNNTNGLRTLSMREMKLMRLRGVCDELSKIVTGVEPQNLERSLAKVGIRSQIFDSKTQHLVNDFVVVPDER
ncbi:MAG: FAD-dependent oxidoreductase, partial [Gammaproteobacteria bacterium]